MEGARVLPPLGSAEGRTLESRSDLRGLGPTRPAVAESKGSSLAACAGGRRARPGSCRGTRLCLKGSDMQTY